MSPTLVDANVSSCASDLCSLSWPQATASLTSHQRYFVRIWAGSRTFTTSFSVLPTGVS